jgi:hypothetical protein
LLVGEDHGRGAHEPFVLLFGEDDEKKRRLGLRLLKGYAGR